MKYYCICSYGEDYAYSVVALTDKEYEILKKIFTKSNANTIEFEYYAANVVLYDKGFETREKAIEYGQKAAYFDGNKKELYHLLFDEEKRGE